MNTKLLILVPFFTGLNSRASEIRCFNAYSKTSGMPILTAEISNQSILKNVRISELIYGTRAENPSTSGMVRGVKPTVKANMGLHLAGDRRLREFRLSKGVKLILPAKLDQITLSDFNIDEKGTIRSNGILIMPPRATGIYAAGDTHLKMICKSLY